MFRKLFILVIALSICTLARAEGTGRTIVRTATTVDSAQGVVLVPTTTTTYSHSMYIPEMADMNVMYKATSSGTVTVKLELQRSYTEPATEYAADDAYVVSSGDVLASSITDETWHMASPDTVQMPYIRFRLTGSGSNDATTNLTIKVGAQ